MWATWSPAPNSHSFLQINGNDVYWGPFSNGDTGHTYTLMYTGNGEPITFRIVDWIDNVNEGNICHLHVTIYTEDAHYGLTPGFWKQEQHFDSWPSTYTPGQTIGAVFDNSPWPSLTLLDALQFKGGNTLQEAKQILARAAVAALLNSETFPDFYPYTAQQVITLTEAQFATGTRTTILTLARSFDNANNMGPPAGW